MADEPVGVIRNAYAAFAVGDIPSVLEVIDPQAEWIETDAEDLPGRGTHIGPDAVAQHVFASVPQHWDEFQIVPEDYFSDGEAVVVRGRVKATAKSTGTSMDAPFVHVFTVRDGKIAKLTNHHDTAMWLQTLGR
jgi:ketosteroid isomerase-like protein